MKQQLFESQRQAAWTHLESLLSALESGREVECREFPVLYRMVCQDLALARERMFSHALVERLNGLALRGHQQLYRVRPSIWRRWSRHLLVDFPRAVRADALLVVLMSLALYGPALGVGWAVHEDSELVYSFASRFQIEQYESMYDPDGDHFGREEDWAAESRAYMFGFYIWNNVGIAFRVFGSGLLFGVGTLFLLLYNGVQIGWVAGHLTRVGAGQPFWGFVCAHGAFELTAITLAGAAGMRLGLSLLSPGPRSRVAAMRESAQRALPVISGAGAMLVIAAGIEAFWSPLPLPPLVKYSVAGFLWLLVFAYLALAGRNERVAD